MEEVNIEDVPAEFYEPARRIFDSIDVPARLELLEEVDCWCIADDKADFVTVDEVEELCVSMIAATLCELYVNGLSWEEATARTRATYGE